MLFAKKMSLQVEPDVLHERIINEFSGFHAEIKWYSKNVDIMLINANANITIHVLIGDIPWPDESVAREYLKAIM